MASQTEGGASPSPPGEPYAQYSFHPIQHPALAELYKAHRQMIWQPEEVTVSTEDRDHWDGLDPRERQLLSFILAFFAQADGIVVDGLLDFQEEVVYKECKWFYAVQAFMETVHNQVYSELVLAFIRDGEERARVLRGAAAFPAVRAIADWVMAFLAKDAAGSSVAPLGDRLIAFMCLEGVFFSSAFAAIYWFKRRGKLPGLCKANEWIARDEALHAEFTVARYKALVRDRRIEAVPQARVHAIVSSAVECGAAFLQAALPDGLPGLPTAALVQYQQCTADHWCQALGYDAIYGVPTPFAWMCVIGMANKTNFFEGAVTEYATASLGREGTEGGTDGDWEVETDF